MQQEALLYDMIMGYQKSQILLVIERLKVADALQDGPKSAEEIAVLLNCKGEYLARILRAAAALDIFHRDPATLLYHLTPVSKLLLDGPASLRSLIELMCSPEHMIAWIKLDQTARDGSVAFETAHGEPLFGYYKKRPDRSEVFNKGMTAYGTLWNLGRVLPTHYPFDSCNTLVDVGGGEGSTIKQLLRTYPKLKGMVFDLEHVVADAKANVQSYADVQERLTFSGGSFFDTIPSIGDHYLVASVIHDWPDDKAVDILKTIHKAMPPQGKVLVVDRVIKEVGGGVGTNLFDIYMMVLVDGKERTEKEFQHIFAAANLRIEEIVLLTPTPYSIIVGSKM